MKKHILSLAVGALFATSTFASDQTRILRQPSISKSHITFVYGGDIWITNLKGENVKRITSTAAVESEPHLSPDGKTIAFTSNRNGQRSVYTVPVSGGEPTRLTWHASNADVRGWSPDGKKVLFSSPQGTAPKSYGRLWTVGLTGEAPELLTHQWGFNGAFSKKNGIEWL